MADLLDPKRLLLLLGLSLFFGLAFEGFYRERAIKPPGGVRTFPLLGLLGAGLYVIDSHLALPFVAGLLLLGAWLLVYYRRRLEMMDKVEDKRGDKLGDKLGDKPDGETGSGIVAPACNLVAYLLGPIALLAPLWFSVGLTVVAVLLLSARERLHALAYRIPGEEVITLGKFLVLSGIILPLLPNQPVTSWTTITPYQVWLAVVAISALSYGSYLTQRYLPLGGSIIFASLLGGLYSSTATTVMLARRLPTANGSALQDMRSGIVLATALMYLRIGVIIAVFNLDLAKQLSPALAVLLLFALVLAFLLHGRVQPGARAVIGPGDYPSNPLELTSAVIFAASFVLISLAANWLKTVIGPTGLLWLAGVIGVADVDPFVLNLAQGGIAGASPQMLVIAVLIAASSNNLLKAAYALSFSGGRPGLGPAGALTALAAAGFGIAAWLW